MTRKLARTFDHVAEIMIRCPEAFGPTRYTHYTHDRMTNAAITAAMGAVDGGQQLVEGER
jgi:hypothetical protein